jgi:aryl-alcohol dehydrogenase-like predicted oxidoreductase
VPIETTLWAMEQAVRQGKIRYFGVSNHAGWRLCEYLWLADKRGWPRVAASQIPFSLLRRQFENDLCFCERHAIGVTPYQSLEGGLLTGKYRRGQKPAAGTRAAEKPEWMGVLKRQPFDQLEAISKLAGEAGVSMTRYALAWTLAQPAMSSLVVGAKRLDQVEDVLGALAVRIPAEHFGRLDEICPPPPGQMDPIRG